MCHINAGTTTSQDAFKTWSLPTTRKALGIATVGDRLHILIAAQLPTPVSRNQVLPLGKCIEGLHWQTAFWNYSLKFYQHRY